MSRNSKSKLSEFNKKESEKVFIKFAYLFYILVGVRILFVDYKYFSYSIIPFFLGLLYQSNKVSENFEEIKDYFKTTILISSYATMPLIVFAVFNMFFGKAGKKFEVLDLYTFLAPYIFLAFFILIITTVNWDKITRRITEGITLLQTFSFIYFCIDSNTFEELNFLTIIKLLICISFTILTLLNAFTYNDITKKTGLFLSIWSTFIIIVFSYSHIKTLLSNSESYNIEEIALTLVNFFLLGTSAIFIAQNLFLLLHYLPGKHASMFSKAHLKQVKEANEMHYKRYSDEQVRIFDSYLYLLFCLTFFSFNYFIKIIPKQTAIWLAFLIFPIIISIKNKFKTNKNLS